jgi:mono/diheme cytochrome c family protein
MSEHMILCLSLGAALAHPSIAVAKPVYYELSQETAVFRPGPGVKLAQNVCLNCHSADYVQFQPPSKGRAFWQTEVQKMIKVYGASIDDADAEKIVDYLVQTY